MRDDKDSRYNSNSRSKGGESQGNSESNISSTTNSIAADNIIPIQAKPLEVKIMGGNNFDKAFRAFRAIVQKERILSVYKEKQSFEKPSDKKRRKKNESRRKAFEATLKAKNPEKNKKKYKEER